MQPSKQKTEVPGPHLPILTALPGRWTPRQRYKNTLIYRALLAGGWLWQHIPMWAIAPCAQILGHVAWAVAGRERRLARAQVAQAIPDAPRGVVRHMFVHLAQSALEVGRLPVLLRQVRLSPQARAVLDGALAEGRGVVAVTGHIGNWELLAQVVAQAGYPVSTIAKPLYDPRLTEWVNNLRQAGGLKVIWRGERGSVKDMLRVFRRGEMLALLIDQDTRVEGAFVPFFKRPAFTPTGAASISLRLGAPVVMFWTHRVASGAHTVHVERLDFTPSGPSQDDVLALTALMTQRLETAIRAAPSQWVWLHARWKRQPGDF